MRALLVVSVAVPLLAFAFVAWFLRAERLDHAREQVEQTATVLEEHALRVFEAQQLIIDRVDQRIAGMSWDEIRGSADIHGYLARLTETSPHVDGLWLVPPGGLTANSADFFPMPEVNTSDRDYYRALSERDELYFGEMIIGRTKGTLNFNISRRRTPRDSFDGLILVTESLDYFSGFWERVSPYPQHVAAIIRPDGEILARSPSAGLASRLPRDAPFLTAVKESETGLYRTPSAVDGVDRIYAYKRIGEYPLYIVYGVAIADVLAPWYADLVPLGLTALATAALLAAISLLAMYQTRRLGSALASWRDTAGRLREEVDRRARAEDLVAEKERLLADLGAATAERKAILDTMLEGVVAYSWDGEVIYFNRASQRILRLSEGAGPTLALLAREGRIHAPDGVPLAEGDAPVARLLRGETLAQEDLRLSFDEGGDAVCRFSGAPLRDGAGGVTGAVLTFADVTEEKASEERRTLLMNELDHRVRNMLATIGAMVRLSSAGAPDKEALVQILSGRIGALTRTHGLLTRNSWRGALLHEIVRDEVQPYASPDRLMMDGGDDVVLPPQDAVDFALVIHELATNAAKYGAWSGSEGRVEVSWRLIDGERPAVRVFWRERGGPTVQPTERAGFGSQLIRSAFRRAEGAGVDLRLVPEGVTCEITIPMRATPVWAPLATPTLKPPAAPMPKALTGRNVLLVEDEAMVRLELAAALETAGARVLGPAANVREAGDIAARERPDAAVLDINLGGETVAPLAEGLAALGVPLVFTSGYRNLELLPKSLRDEPLLQKPVSPDDLLSALADRIAGRSVTA